MAKQLSILALCLVLGCVMSYDPFSSLARQPAQISSLPHDVSKTIYDIAAFPLSITHFNNADNFLSLWGFDTTFNYKNIKITRRNLELDTLEQADEDVSYTLPLPYTNCQNPVALPNGYFAVVCNGIDVYLYTFEASTGVPKNLASTKVGSQPTPAWADAINVKTTWYQDGYFYIVYDLRESNVYTTKIQGFNVASPSTTKFASPLVLLQPSNVEIGSYIYTLKCDQFSGNNKAVCTWKFANTKNIFAVEIDLSQGVIGNKNTITTDTKDTTYTLSNLIGLQDRYVIILGQAVKQGSIINGGLAAKISTRSDIVTLNGLGMRGASLNVVHTFADGNDWGFVVQLQAYMMQITYITKYDSLGNSKGGPSQVLQSYNILNSLTTQNNSHYLLFTQANAFSSTPAIYIGQVPDISPSYVELDFLQNY